MSNLRDYKFHHKQSAQFTWPKKKYTGQGYRYIITKTFLGVHYGLFTELDYLPSIVLCGTECV